MSRNVLVTGSSRGIGAAIAMAFAAQGDNVGINYRYDREGAEEVCEQIRKLGVKAEIYQANVGDRAEVEKMFKSYFEDFGTIDVLVNNAGGAMKIPDGRFEDMPLDYWDDVLALNLSAAAYCSNHAVRNMVANKTRGAIINISSVHSFVTYVKRKTFPYCAAKAGLNMLTKTMGCDVIRHGIRVNAIAPGFISTKLTTRYTQEEIDAYRRKIPAGRLGTVNDIAPLALFLADETKSGFIIGQTIPVDGGQSIDGIIDYMMQEEMKEMLG